MIKGVVGLMGSGKSNYVVENDVIPFLRQPEGNLYHSIEGLRVDRICIDYGLNYFEVIKRVEFLGEDAADGEMDASHVRGLAGRILSGDVPPGSLFVIDEIHKVWPHKPSTNVENMSREWDAVLAEQRKWKLNFIVITQNIERLNIAWRCRVDLLLRMKRLAFLGSMTAESYTITFMTSTGPGRFERYRQDKKFYNKKVFEYYRSYKKGVDASKFKHDATLYAGRGIVKMWHVGVAVGIVGLIVYLTMTGNGYVSKAVLGNKETTKMGEFKSGGGVNGVAVPSGVSANGGNGAGSIGTSAAVVPVFPLNVEKREDKPVLVGCMSFDGKHVAVYEASDGSVVELPMECEGLALGEKSPADMKTLRGLEKRAGNIFGKVMSVTEAEKIKWGSGGVQVASMPLRWGEANNYGGRDYTMTRPEGEFPYENLAGQKEKPVEPYPKAKADEKIFAGRTITEAYSKKGVKER